MPGMTIAANISGSLDAKNIVMGVLHKGIELSNLQSAIKTTIQVPKLDANIPIVNDGAVHEDVKELEETVIDGASFSNINFSLLKDRVELAVSDEARFRSNAGNPLDLQIQGAGASLANVLDKKIVAALETSPQTGATAGAWSTKTNSPLKDIGVAMAALKPYAADYMIVTPTVYGHYLSNDLVLNSGTGNPAAMTGAMGKVPGANLDIFVSSHVTAATAIIGSSTGMSAVLGQGPVEVREWDNPNNGSKNYQIDVWRQVKAPIFTTAASLNQSCYVITGLS